MSAALQQLLNFSQQDLDFNRAGRYSPAQKARLHKLLHTLGLLRHASSAEWPEELTDAHLPQLLWSEGAVRTREESIAPNAPSNLRAYYAIVDDGPYITIPKAGMGAFSPEERYRLYYVAAGQQDYILLSAEVLPAP